MKRILQDQTKRPTRVFETDYGYLIKSRCGWPHRSKAQLYVVVIFVLMTFAMLIIGMAIHEIPRLVPLANTLFGGGVACLIFLCVNLYEYLKKPKKDEPPKKEKSPEEKAPNLTLKFKIDADKMQVTARFGVEQKFTASIEPTSLFSLDDDRFRYISGDINTSKFEVQIAPRKRLTIVGYRRDTIGEMIDLARVLNHLLDEVREGEEAPQKPAVKATASGQTEAQNSVEHSNPLD